MYLSHTVAFLRITWFFHQKVESCNKELVDCLDIIMREVVNAYKGIKEPMHVIMEEDAVYEQSIIMSQSNLSDMENFPGMDASDLNISEDPSLISEHKSKNDDRTTDHGDSFKESENLTPNTNSQMQQDALPTYSEPEQKDGHVLFSILKSDIMKAFSLKSFSKADNYLDRVTFIARKLVGIWFGQEISIENFNLFVELLKEKAYLTSFPFLIESFRKLGYFEIDRNGYQPFCELLLACLSEVISFN